jgi:hypothetical protein
MGMLFGIFFFWNVFAYHLAPVHVRVPQVGNPWFRLLTHFSVIMVFQLLISWKRWKNYKTFNLMKNYTFHLLIILSISWKMWLSISWNSTTWSFFRSLEKCNFRSPEIWPLDHFFDLLKNVTFDLLKFDLLIILSISWKMWYSIIWILTSWLLPL